MAAPAGLEPATSRLTGARSTIELQGNDELVDREGIEPPESKTADLQSAELTTCSTYPLSFGPEYDYSGTLQRWGRPITSAIN